MDYMKYAPESRHEEYNNEMQGIWPEDSRKSNRLYTYEGCATIRELGRGQHTIVRKAICLSNLQVVAVKEIIGRHPEFRNDMQLSLDQFYGTLQKINSSDESKEIIDDINECDKPIFSIHEEYQVWLLPSQYICNTYGAYMNPNTGSVCLVFEHMMNGTLEDQINFGVQPDERNIGTVAYVILNALSEMHDHNCIHRDIKPSNILIGDVGIVKVSDSFIIRTYDDVSSCRTFSGTLMYMSPERVKGQFYTLSSDIWSLGILLLRYGSNSFPYPVSCPWTLAEAILKGPSKIVLEIFSSDLQDFISQCIQLEPLMRPTARDLLKHPFIQKYHLDRMKEGQDPSCLTSYENTKLQDSNFNKFDLETALELVIEDHLEHQLSKIWIDLTNQIDMEPLTLSSEDLEYLSRQMQLETEFTTKLFNEKNSPMCSLLKLCAQLVKLDSRSFSPKFIKILAKHIITNHETIVQQNDKKNQNNESMKLLNPLKLLSSALPLKDNEITDDTDEEKIVKFLQSCRIPLSDAKIYTRALIDQGYDDMKSIQEDIDLSTLESIMKPGHHKRALSGLQLLAANLESHSKTSTIPIFANDIEDPRQRELEDTYQQHKFPLDRAGLKLKHERESYCKPIEDVELRDAIDAGSLYSNKTVYYIREIGRGSSGIVYKSFVIPTINLLAVKHVVIPTLEKQKQIFNELKALWNLSKKSKKEITMTGKFADLWSNNISPFFVPFYNAYVDLNNSGICMVFENMAGGSLQFQIDKKLDPDNDDIAAVAWSMLNALIELHSKNIIHRDIKPGNILISHNGSVKCADFGVVKELEDTSSAKTFTGTLLYMSPERILGKPYTKAADIWSLGVSLMVYATNLCPYPINGYWVLSEAIRNGPSMHALRSFPEDFKDFIKQCVAIEEENRSSAEELIKHPFITKFLDKCYRVAADPAVLKHFTLFSDSNARQRDLNTILDALIKLETTKYLEKLWNPEELEKLNVNDLEGLELLSKTQLVWLASQLILDTSYVQGIYTKKLLDLRSVLKTSLIMHLQNFGRALSEKGIVETVNIMRSGTDVMNRFKQQPTSELDDSVPTGLKLQDNLQSAPVLNKHLEGSSDAATLSIGLKPQEPFQFLRSTSGKAKFCNLKRVLSNADFSGLKCIVDFDNTEKSRKKDVSILSPTDLLLELSKLGQPVVSEQPRSLWSDQMKIGARIGPVQVSESSDGKPVQLLWKEIQDIKPEASSDISLFDSNSSESPILVRQSFNDPNDPLLNRDKYNESEGQFSSLSDGYESESDIIEYDGLYF